MQTQGKTYKSCEEIQDGHDIVKDFRKRSSTTQSKDSVYTDSSGVDLLRFITETLHKNQRDREFLMEIEKVMRDFVSDKTQEVYKFSSMSSYNRMLVHRVAAFFGLDHNVDQSGTAVVINKSDTTRMPETKFDELVSHSNFADRYQYRRSVQSFDEGRLSDYIALYGPNYPQGGTMTSPVPVARRAQSFDAKQWYGAEIAEGATTIAPLLPTLATPVLAAASSVIPPSAGLVADPGQTTTAISSSIPPPYSWPYYYGGYQWTPGQTTENCAILIPGTQLQEDANPLTTSLISPAVTATPIYYPAPTPPQYALLQQSPSFSLYAANPPLGEIPQQASDDNISYLSAQLAGQMSFGGGTSHSQSPSFYGSSAPTTNFPTLRRALSSPARDFRRPPKSRPIIDPKRKRQRSYGAVEKDLATKNIESTSEGSSTNRNFQK